MCLISLSNKLINVNPIRRLPLSWKYNRLSRHLILPIIDLPTCFVNRLFSQDSGDSGSEIRTVDGQQLKFDHGRFRSICSLSLSYQCGLSMVFDCYQLSIFVSFSGGWCKRNRSIERGRPDGEFAKTDSSTDINGAISSVFKCLSKQMPFFIELLKINANIIK